MLLVLIVLSKYSNKVKIQREKRGIFVKKKERNKRDKLSAMKSSFNCLKRKEKITLS